MNTKHTDSFDESYHYWRECHKCGHAGNHYLHCLHDKIQSDCIKCGDKLPSIPQDCDCEFATTETELDMNTKHTDSVDATPALSPAEYRAQMLKEMREALQNNLPFAVNHEFPAFMGAFEKRIDGYAATLQATQSQQVEEAVRKEREKIIGLLDWRNRKDGTQFHDGSDVVDWYDKKIEALTPNHQD